MLIINLAGDIILRSHLVFPAWHIRHRSVASAVHLFAIIMSLVTYIYYFWPSIRHNQATETSTEPRIAQLMEHRILLDEIHRRTGLKPAPVPSPGIYPPPIAAAISPSTTSIPSSSPSH